MPIAILPIFFDLKSVLDIFFLLTIVVTFVLKALKQDIIRSIIARCEIHCEDLLVIEEEQQGTNIFFECNFCNNILFLIMFQLIEFILSNIII